MAKITNSFWTALIEHCQDHEDIRVRLWNGYVGWKCPDHLTGKEPQADRSWPQYVVDAPPGGWPELTENEKSLLDQIAAKNGGHPSWIYPRIMDFSGRSFKSKIIFSDLTLVAVDFSKSDFQKIAEFDRTRFFMKSRFTEAFFVDCVSFIDAVFEADVNFDFTRFRNVAFLDRIWRLTGNNHYLSGQL